jgi:hypothetical protein
VRAVTPQARTPAARAAAHQQQKQRGCSNLTAPPLLPPYTYRQRCQITSCAPCKSSCVNDTSPFAAVANGSSTATLPPLRIPPVQTAAFTNPGWGGAFTNPSWGGLLVRGVPMSGLSSGFGLPPFYTAAAGGRRLKSQAVAPHAAAADPTAGPEPGSSRRRQLLQGGSGLFSGAIGSQPRFGRPVNCLRNPCDGYQGCSPGMVCVPNYFGGCYTDCVPAVYGTSGSQITGGGGPSAVSRGGGAPPAVPAGAGQQAQRGVNGTAGAANSTRPAVSGTAAASNGSSSGSGVGTWARRGGPASPPPSTATPAPPASPAPRPSLWSRLTSPFLGGSGRR